MKKNDIEICFEIRVTSDKEEDVVVGRYEFIRPEKVTELLVSTEKLGEVLQELIRRTRCEYE